MWGERVYKCFSILLLATCLPVASLAQTPLPVNKQMELNAAIEDFQFGDIEAAIARLESLHKQYPDQPQILQFLARAYSEGGRHDEAIEAYRGWLALSADPNGDEARFAHIGLASEMIGSGRGNDAASQLQTWLAAHPDDRNARVMYGDLLVRLNSFDEAGQVWNALLDDPATGRSERAGACYYLAWIAQRQGDSESAGKLAMQSLQIESDGVYSDPARKLLAMKPSRGFDAAVSVGEYYISNVELLPDYVPVTAGKKNSDYVTSTRLTLSYRFPSLLISYDFDGDWHARRNDFDLGTHKLAVVWGSGEWAVAPRYEYTTLSNSFLYQAGAVDVSWHRRGWALAYGAMYKNFSNSFSVDPAVTAPTDLRRLGGFTNALSLIRSGSEGDLSYSASIGIIDEATKGDATHNKTDSYRQASVSGNMKRTFGKAEAGISADAYYRKYNRPDPLANGLERRDQYFSVSGFAAVRPWESLAHRFELNASWQNNNSNYNQNNVAPQLAKEYRSWQAGVAWGYIW